MVGKVDLVDRVDAVDSGDSLPLIAAETQLE